MVGRKKKTSAEPYVLQQPLLSGRAQTMEMNTRRSARQQQRQAAAGTSRRMGLNEEFEFSPPTRTTVAAASSSSSSQAQKQQQRRFPAPQGKAAQQGRNKQESTAALLNRLIPKKGAASPATSTSRGSGGYKQKTTQQSRMPSLTPRPAASSSKSMQQQQQQPARNIVSGGKISRIMQQQAWVGHAMPLKVEVNVNEEEQYMDDDPSYVPVLEGPKKRGRKRKVDTANTSMPHQVSVKPEHGYRVVTVEEAQRILEQNQYQPQPPQQRKRGRQATATSNVKPRFPFCSICLSSATPNDYIINHMSCPNEYQRMKRLFSYIYKDLKYPFAPFDLERENVFDYCDLPLCDNCIVLYQEIYDSYAKIEEARDQLKAKIERMAFTIQLAEKTPAVSAQLNQIKSSADPLMNKYCNFRKRFSSYKAGDSRAESEGAALLPATIARVRVINQIPKRTTASQTFLTAGHFPPPPPPAPPASSSESSASQGSDAAASTSKEASKKDTVGTPPVIVKTEPGTESSPPSASGPKANSELKSKQPSTSTASSSTSSKIVIVEPPSKSRPSTSSAAPASTSQTVRILQRTSAATASPGKIVQSSCSVATPPTKNVPTTATPPVKTIPSSSVATPPAPAKNLPSTSTPPPPKPATNVFQLKKEAVILPASPKLPPSKPFVASMLTIIKTPGGKGPAIIRKMPVIPPGSPAVNGQQQPTSSTQSPAKEKQAAASKHSGHISIVKDEPKEAPSETAEDPDPYLNSPSKNKKQPQGTASSADGDGDNSQNDASSSSASEDTSDTNVFRKHKKLHATPSEDKNESQSPKPSDD